MKSFELVSIITYTLTQLIPKKKNLWVFGSWFGNNQSDNSKAFSDYVHAANPDIEIVWVVNNESEYSLDYGKPIKRNSIKSLKYLCRAQVAVMNQGFGDLSAFNFLGGCYKVQLTHGVGWKKFARDTLNIGNGMRDKLYLKCFDYINTYDLYVTPSEKQICVMKSSLNATDNTVVRCGQPRNEVLFSESYLRRCKKNILEELGIKENKKIVVYMPTFRDNTDEVFSFGDINASSAIQEQLASYDYIIIEKLHPVSFKRKNFEIRGNLSGIYYMPTVPAEVLLAAADILITDYSSCFFDYLITDRPIIHFLYDYEYYKNSDRGVYYELDEVVAGDCPKELKELMIAIENNISDPIKNSLLRKSRRDQYITYESPENSRIIYERIIGDLS